jgi:hypothetical protein
MKNCYASKKNEKEKHDNENDSSIKAIKEYKKQYYNKNKTIISEQKKNYYA